MSGQSVEVDGVLTNWDRDEIADACDAMMQFGDTWLRFIRDGDETVLLPVIERLVKVAQAEVANAFVAWAAANEIAEPPLDWAWFGEITRRYSPLHEGHGDA